MRSSSRVRFAIATVTALVFAITAGWLWHGESGADAVGRANIVSGVAAAISLFLTFVVYVRSPRAMDATNSPLRRILLVGDRGVGKTHYSAALFSELMTNGLENYEFVPDQDTTRWMMDTWRKISSGDLLQATPMDKLYLFRGDLIPRERGARRLWWHRRDLGSIKIEVADSAGERLDEFLPGSSLYAESSPLFRYAQGAGAIFFMIDYISLAGYGKEHEPSNPALVELSIMQARLRDANVLAKADKASTVVVITKCDLALEGTPSLEREEFVALVLDKLRVTTGYAALRAVLNSLSLQPDICLVSSVGGLSRGGDGIQPINVLEPLERAVEGWHRETGKNSFLGRRRS